MIYCIPNLILTNSRFAKIIKERISDLPQILAYMIDSSTTMSKEVLVSIILCFEALLNADLLSEKDLALMIPILMVTLRIKDSGDEIRFITLRLFAKLSNTFSETILLMLTSGNTIEVLMDSWSRCTDMGNFEI